MRIVVENGSHHLKNMGDLAMLQVAVQRLNKIFPTAQIKVFTDVPAEELNKYCPGAIPIENKYHGDYFSAIKRKTSDFLVGHKYQFNQAIKQIIDEADLIVTAGGGYLGVDAFKYHAISVIDLVKLANNAGKTTAILGHGFSPTKDQLFRKKLTNLLSEVDLIAVREQITSVPLLKSFGVTKNQIAITGDDAVELAYQNRRDKQGDAIGVNIRMSNYSNIEREAFNCIKEALVEASKAFNTKLISTPISLVDEESDVATARALNLDEDGQGLDSPLKVIQQVGRCRVVVTGSYHAGVFALSQGIPVVALASSKYYQEKFLGLADQFEVGCKVILFSNYPNTLKEEISQSIQDAWEKAEYLQIPLLNSAQKQIESGYLAYETLADLVERQNKSNYILPKV
ncbi:polysaccharide pyruvyl transferase family protein [Anabaena subtropica]|uniref:Polysaccharide pyruvyl transferase family protein n=1 Tax=Anabaena subtropica FACHB-260 TaxID=2692884 RepID=A0ABR8CQN7_9NOST|nr:polysaccharide pyruvyl transferase family protein [Anabaena subtropica]MBD2345354.1 polysaccharide pyruvyl transferase family protein [Anabaena subtropica FACHB-260]